MYINTTYQHDNDIMIQYDMHQYVKLSIIQYERHAHIYSFHTNNAIYEYTKQKK